MTPFISIVIPSRNRPAALQQCIASCLALDYPRFEVIVIDDGSEPALSLETQDPRVRMVRQKNTGPAGARNHGLALAQGERIAFTDDDCRPRPDWLRVLAQAWTQNPNAMLGGQTCNGLPRDACASTSQFLVDFLYEHFETRNPEQRFFTSNNLAVARDRLREYAGFDATFPLPAAEDRDLCDRWRERGDPLLHVPGAIVDHFHHMTLLSFLRQQYNYGRGAKVLRARRSARGAEYPIEPRGFYVGLFAAPFRRMGFGAALRAASLLFAAQVANVAGFFAQRENHRIP